MIVRQAANVLEIMELFAQTRKPATAQAEEDSGLKPHSNP